MLPITSYRPSPAFLSLLESGELPSEIVREHVREYEKKKRAYKRIIYGYVTAFLFLIAAAAAIPCTGTILLLFFVILAGGIFARPLLTRLSACNNLLSIIRKKYPDL